MKKATQETTTSRLYRSKSNKMLGGVAGGLGEYLNIDPTIIRIGFILLGLLNGIGILLYLLMWIFIPSTSTKTGLDNEETIKENIAEMKQTAQSFGHTLHFKHQSTPENSRSWWAILIIALGFFFLFKNFGIFDVLDIERFWPVILIVAGLIFLLRK